MKRCGRLLQGKGIDIDQKCVELANINKRKNLNQEQLQNLTFHRQNFLDFSVGSVHEPYDFIVSNPPYVSMEDYLEFDQQIKNWESKASFVSEDQGLGFTIQLLKFAKANLKSDGFVILELCPITIDLLLNRLSEDSKSDWRHIQIYKDIYGKNRFITLFPF